MRRLRRAAPLLLALATATAAAQEGGPAATFAARGAGTLLASELGAIEVVTPAGEPLGDVDDAILSRDGRIVALVVGLGGVLGLAERPVAIRYAHFTVRAAEDGFELVCDLDRAALERAPSYRERER